MEPTTISLHTGFAIGQVDRRLFGGFAEHMGRCIYEGLYDPASPHADEDGFRGDVLAALRQLGMTVMRYPGGNFASGYRWTDGVGPRDGRPAVLDLAWNSREPNAFGTDEFVRLCRKMDWAPMLTVNLGTGTPADARDWVEYCNRPPGTRWADRRAANGTPDPHAVPLWCLGNEMDGPWQLGHVPADQYAVRAAQAAKMMKDVDPSIEVVACGSSGPAMPTFGEWDRQVLEVLADQADYISLHRYVGNAGDDTADYLAVTNAIDRQIEAVDAVCRYVQARNRSAKRAYLCFDEWNVWYKDHQTDGQGQAAPHLIEEVYNLEDALVVAGFLNSFIRHADVVKIANLAQVVNVIAPILTDGERMLLQSSFDVFAMYSRRREGVSLRPAVAGPNYDAPTHGRANSIDAAAILGPEVLHVFATNRHQTEAAAVRIDLADRSISAFDAGEVLTGPDAKAANAFDAPDVVRCRPMDAVAVADGSAEIILPPLAVAAMTFRL